MSENSSTIKYYHKNAEHLAQRYESARVKEMQELLKSCLNPGAKLLERLKSIYAI